MTNYEKYKDFIKEHIESDETFGIVNGIPKDCREISCDKCIFNNRCYANYYKDNSIFEFFTWLNAEIKEPYILTEEELAFCLMVKTGYLWRNLKYNNLFYSKEKPTKDLSPGYINLNSTFFYPLLFPSFDFVGDELVSIEDILNNYIVSGDNNG
jgi:hypothetical protein